MPTYVSGRHWWRRLLILIPLSLAAVVAMTALIVLSFQNEAKSSLFVVGATIGNLALVSVLVVGNVRSRRRVDLRRQSVRATEPDALVQELVLDAPTCVSLERLGVLDAALSASRFHANNSALDLAVSEQGMRIYAGLKVAREIIEIPWQEIKSVTAVHVHRNGLKATPVLRLQLNAPTDGSQLFLTVGSRRWSGVASQRHLDDLCVSLNRHLREMKPHMSGDVLAVPPRAPFGHPVASNIGFGARTYFNRYRVLVGVLGCIYVTGWVNSALVFLTRALSPFVTGIAASYLNVFLFGVILLFARRAYVSALLREIRSGYTTLRWLVGDIPQVDEVSGRVVRVAGVGPLSKEEEEADFAKVRSMSR